MVYYSNNTKGEKKKKNDLPLVPARSRIKRPSVMGFKWLSVLFIILNITRDSGMFEHFDVYIPYPDVRVIYYYS